MTNPVQLSAGNAAFDSLVSDWMVALNERGMSARTRDEYLHSMRDLKAWLVAHGSSLAPTDISAASIQEWLTDPTIHRSGAVRRARWTAARSFFSWVQELGITATDPMAEISAPVSPPADH